VPTSKPADRAAIERWLRAHGVPNFVEGHASLPRILPRMVLAAAITAGVLIAARVWLGGSDRWLLDVLAIVIAAAAAAAMTYLVVATGIVPLVGFALRWFARTVLRGGATMMSVLPLLLVAVAFLFLGAETWQSVGRLHGLPLVLTALLFGSLGVGFVLRQVRPDLDAMDTFADPDLLRAALPSDLVWPEAMVVRAWGSGDGVLRRGERMNLQAVTATAQVTVATVVGLAVFAFFVIFGTLVVDTDTVRAWSTEIPQVWWQARIAGHHYALTSEHVRVSAFLGVFSAFYFVVSASTDKALRVSLTEGAQQHARTCLAVRAVYRATA
jgi:hypothetical protein